MTVIGDVHPICRQHFWANLDLIHASDMVEVSDLGAVPNHEFWRLASRKRHGEEPAVTVDGDTASDVNVPGILQCDWFENN